MGKLSFKFKIQTMLGLLSVTALVMVGYLAHAFRTQLIQNKTDLLSRSAESIADKVDRNLFERYGDVQAFALSEPARSGDPVRINRFMTDMMAAYAPVYDAMIVVDLSGKVIAANAVDKFGKQLSSDLIVGKNLSSEDWFKKAVGGEIPAGKAFFSDLEEDSLVQSYVKSNGRVMNFVAPIRSSITGEIVGVWSNRMSWTDVVEDIVNKESQKLKDDRLTKITAHLVGESGLFLVHTDSEAILKRTASYQQSQQGDSVTTWSHLVDQSEDISETAIEVVTRARGYSSYPGKKWAYVLRAPASDYLIRTATYTSIFGFVLILIIMIGAVRVTTGMVRGLEDVIEHLDHGSEELSTMAVSVTSSAHSMSEVAVQQSSALQQTASSIEEINAMIKKSSDNAKRSQDVSQSSALIAKRGEESVQNMTVAIDQINVSNEAILKQIVDSTDQIAQIAKVIADIGQKTTVINDIVFQTKLLSFNASVEAARAGEHGKGFAVVAEEVGNLAQMSGNAAKEISTMLSESIRNVETVVAETRKKVEFLVSDGREKVQSGVAIATECGVTLSEVVSNVETLQAMIVEISSATHEQSLGVNEITKAMNELDHTNQANTQSTQSVAHDASTLSRESAALGELVSSLVVLVHGAQKRRTKRSENQPSQDLALRYSDHQLTGPKSKLTVQSAS